MSRALVTGATGMLGGYLAALLLDQGIEVRALVRTESDISRIKSLEIELASGDTRDRDFINEAVAGCEYVFHVASHLSASATFGDPGQGAARRYWDANVVLTEDLLSASLDHSAERFVFVSSSSVYGYEAASPIHENSPAEPVTIYGRSKLAAEQLVWSFQRRGLDGTVVRPGIIYGTGDRYFLPLVDELIQMPVFILVDGGHARHDLTFAGDVAQLLWLASQKKEAVGRVYNAGSGQPLSVREIADVVGRVYGRLPRIVDLPRSVVVRLTGLVGLYVTRMAPSARDLITPITFEYLSKDIFFDIYRARHELGFRPEVSFEEGLRTVREEARHA